MTVTTFNLLDRVRMRATGAVGEIVGVQFVNHARIPSSLKQGAFIEVRDSYVYTFALVSNDSANGEHFECADIELELVKGAS